MADYSVYELLNKKRRGAPLEVREIEFFIEGFTLGREKALPRTQLADQKRAECRWTFGQKLAMSLDQKSSFSSERLEFIGGHRRLNPLIRAANSPRHDPPGIPAMTPR